MNGIHNFIRHNGTFPSFGYGRAPWVTDLLNTPFENVSDIIC